MCNCPYRLEHKDSTLQKNALRIEIMTPELRCALKFPKHWSQAAKDLGAMRWVLSGGTPLVFGVCDKNCPQT